MPNDSMHADVFPFSGGPSLNEWKWHLTTLFNVLIVKRYLKPCFNVRNIPLVVLATSSLEIKPVRKQ